ncbi:transposase [Paenibacillus sp. YN15]|uniref:transposase n=1 Tax=Paenibacillus sp. YN15 TaxID=1742774 RepID=UPI0015EB85DB|nr:transposase [Paenibacillus sp. YN15]
MIQATEYFSDETDLSTEAACASCLYSLKWPNGFVCPQCRHSRAYTITSRRLPLFECANCRLQVSLTTGTIMEGSRTSLVKWFAAIRLMSRQDRGISAAALSGLLKVTYKTAWTMLHRIRTVMAEEELAVPLEGRVAIHDDSYARPLYNPSVIPHARETRLIVGATLSEAGEPERMTVQTIKQEHLYYQRVTREAIEWFKESRMDCNARLVYCPINFYVSPRHKKILPVMKDARQWLNTTFHGIGKKYLQTYLLEFCCRANLALASIPAFPAICRICASSPVPHRFPPLHWAS